MAVLLFCTLISPREQEGPMPNFIGEKDLTVNPRSDAIESGHGIPPRVRLDASLRLKLAEFASFLDEIEDCSAGLRVDQLEQVISHAVASCGFGSSTEARRALEWMFHQTMELS
jgi:hypothetical protein